MQVQDQGLRNSFNIYLRIMFAFQSVRGVLAILLMVSLISSSVYILSLAYRSAGETTDALINAQMLLLNAEANHIYQAPHEQVSREEATNLTYDERYPSGIGTYDSRDLLHPDDQPWGRTYPSRVWCSVLTMWPERRQNIEVETVLVCSMLSILSICTGCD